MKVELEDWAYEFLKPKPGLRRPGVPAWQVTTSGGMTKIIGAGFYVFVGTQNHSINFDEDTCAPLGATYEIMNTSSGTLILILSHGRRAYVAPGASMRVVWTKAGHMILPEP